jgi:putative drug exporter of the RND superfamily
VAAFLDRLGRTAARRHRRFIAAWVLGAIAIAALAIASGGNTFDNFTIPGTQSQSAIDLLESRFAEQSGAAATVVFHAPSGTLAAGTAAAAIRESLSNMKALPQAPQVTGPVPGKDPAIAIAQVQYAQQGPQLGVKGFDALQAAAAPARAAGLQVAFGGPFTDYAESPKSSSSDLVGLLFAVIILVFAFGSLVAAGLPIGTALLGLAVGMSAIFLLASVTDVGTAAPELGAMIGLGVGIDYSLFIVTRHRENLASGMEIEASVGHAVSTAGQAVLFAGTTVVIAICGLLVAGIPYVAVLGFTAAIVVAIMMLAALTLLPALLGWLGPRIDKGRVPGLHLGRHHHEAAERAASADAPTKPPFWERWATGVARHKWPFALLSILVLLTLAAPFLWIRYGEADDGTAPEGSTQRIAFDLIAQGFGPGANGPLAVVVTLPKGQEVPAELTTALAAAPGVAQVVPPQLNPAGNTAIITVIPTTAPDAEATTDLVDHLRAVTVPAALRGTGVTAYVGGITAAFIDIGNRIADRLPFFIGLVVLLSFLLLMLVFHSIAIPATAAIMNLLSVGAAYGVTVAVFQWGWGKGLFGLSSTIPIVSFVPMMMFAILFGLSMDYQVFLLTRIREEYNASGDTRTAVVKGVSHTARVITSAALIMIAVFLSFVASPIPEIKMFGLGLAVAVAVDSTIVRMVLVPAIMEILGKANWWFPAWLERILPKITIE